MKAIVGNKIYTASGCQSGCLIIDGENIVDILPKLPKDFSGEVHDYGDLTITPGFIDPHVHVNEPGRTHWEGFETATKAAAAGGVTTLVDMPLNSSPVTTNVEALETKLAAAQDKLWIDCGFWGGVTSETIGDLPDLVNSGVLGIKSFYIDSGIDEFALITEENLSQVMPIIAQANIPYLVHAELDGGERIAVGSNYQAFVTSRPTSWENKAIESLIRLAEEHKCLLHIVHLSSAESIEQIRQAKEKSSLITVETCPHYLVLCSEEIPDSSPIYKCCPPIRSRENNEQLWEALREGLIDFVASDHSPAPPEIKCLDTGDLEKAWGGIASLQFTLSLLWTGAKSRNFQVLDVCRMIKNAATFIGQSQHKGEIAVGKHADLAIWNPDEEFTIITEEIYHRHKCTPYLNNKVFGKVYHTYVRGEKVYSSGQFAKTPTGVALLRNTK